MSRAYRGGSLPVEVLAEIAEATARNFSETARIFDLRFKAGVVAKTEVMQVNSQAQQALRKWRDETLASVRLPSESEVDRDTAWTV